jgi:hypothetical protein
MQNISPKWIKSLSENEIFVFDSNLKSNDLWKEEALQKIVNAHMPLVSAVASWHKDYPVSMRKIIDAGTIGLTEAIKQYDRSRNKAFMPCAFKMIVDYIEKEIDLQIAKKLQIKTVAAAIRAVKNNSYNLGRIPEHLKNYKICYMALKNGYDVFKFVPDNLKDAKLCRMAVRYSYWALKLVPDRLKTEELCIMSVREDWRMLEFVPEELILNLWQKTRKR